MLVSFCSSLNIAPREKFHGYNDKFETFQQCEQKSSVSFFGWGQKDGTDKTWGVHSM